MGRGTQAESEPSVLDIVPAEREGTLAVTTAFFGLRNGDGPAHGPTAPQHPPSRRRCLLSRKQPFVGDGTEVERMLKELRVPTILFQFSVPNECGTSNAKTVRVNSLSGSPGRRRT